MYIVSVLVWTVVREWPWTHTVFFVLHALVMLMKQHSEAFYNGYLSEIYLQRAKLQQNLRKLNNATASHIAEITIHRGNSSTTSTLPLIPNKSEDNSDIHQRNVKGKDDVVDEALSVDQVLSILDSERPIEFKKVGTFRRVLQDEIDSLSEDLKGKSTTSRGSYPNNLCLSNHFEYIVLPTLVYELEYPRSDRISWSYVAEKVTAIFGILGIMNLVSQAFIYPVVIKTIEMKDVGMSFHERLQIFPWILLDLMGPFMMEYLLVSRTSFQHGSVAQAFSISSCTLMTPASLTSIRTLRYCYVFLRNPMNVQF